MENKYQRMTRRKDQKRESEKLGKNGEGKDLDEKKKMIFFSSNKRVKEKLEKRIKMESGGLDKILIGELPSHNTPFYVHLILNLL